MPTPADREGRKWASELQSSHKREANWRKEADGIVKRYGGESRDKARFNVLWSNTQILRPAIYNSRPNPDVRRRFRDADPVGKAVSEVLERSLAIVIDGDETDDAIKNDVLDCLLPGRGVSRVRYVPRISAVQKDKGAIDLDDKDDIETADDGEEQSPPDEQLDGESCCVEHVDYRDYREGYGRVWAEVPWIAFRHKLSRKDALEKFDKADLREIEFTTQDTDDTDKGGEEGPTQKVAEFWEMWDKISGKVFFLNEQKKRLIYPKDTPKGEAPFDIEGFFPSPKPLNINPQTGTRVPVPMFRMYEAEAQQLDKICRRIDKLIDVIRARGVYDSKIPELADLMSNVDGELTPVTGAQAWLEGGLDKAISWLPIEMLANVLQQLYDARDKQKMMIDELIGITDIQRGATDPDETLGAQEIKQHNSSVRLQDMQREVQRYVKDLLRICTSVMSEKFSQQTFALQTELNFPTAEQKQQAQAALQQMQAPPPAAPGAPPQPPPQPPPQLTALLKMPTWDDIIGVMRSEKLRSYKVDVETDSTIAATLTADMAGMSQVLKSVTEALTEMAPLIQAGSLPVEAAKEIVMAIIRRARMGLAVEDAFDKLAAPKPPPNPKLQEIQAKGQADAATTHAKMQADAQASQAQAQADMQIAKFQADAKANADIQVAKIKAQMDAWQGQQEQSQQAAQNRQEQFMEQQREQQKQANEVLMNRFDNATKILIAQIGAQSKVDAAAESAADAEVAKDV